MPVVLLAALVAPWVAPRPPAEVQAAPAVVSPGHVPAPEAPADSLAVATIRKLVGEANHPLLRWPQFPDLQADLERFYEGRDFEPAWLDDSVEGEQRVGEALALLGDAVRSGLRPQDYDASMLFGIWSAAEAGLEGYEAALFDVGLTVGLLRHLSDLSLGRVDPRNLNFGFNVEPGREDFAGVLERAIETGSLRAAFSDAEPGFLQYRLLLRALERYRSLAEIPRRPLPGPASSLVRPGEIYNGLPFLRARLIAVGDLDDAAGPIVPTGRAEADSLAHLRYQGPIVSAVERFQVRHGLEVDGVIGPRTFAALDVPMADRAEQIELALERLRWLPALDHGPFIIVNIPAFELWAYDGPARGAFLEEGPAERMRVVVGRALSTQTPVFTEDMRWTDFRPYWNVPYSITVREILPQARRDPGYLEANDYEIVPEFGNDVDALPVTRENIERLGSGQLHVRQRPGPNNALGLVKFIFPNNANVYLHSTPATELFSRTRRDFSHGCVRVGDPVALSEFVLRNDGREWSRDRILEAMNGGRPTRVILRRPIPVVIFYTTALVEPDGTVYFYDDLYGHDATLRGALAVGYPYPR